MSSPTTFCGIDFGTTNSTVAIVKDGQPIALDIDPDNSNPKILKSLFYLNPQGDRIVGKAAINRYLWDVQHIPAKQPILVDTGRKIKTLEASSSDGVGKVIWVPELIEVDDSGRGRLLQSLKSTLTSTSFIGTNVFGKFYTLEELLTQMMTEIKSRAEKLLSHNLNSVVLGRPVRYVGEGNEKLALERMEKIAHNSGFRDVAFEYEPVGAALNYGLDINGSSNVLVFDFGGGTLDVCIMKFPEKKVVSVSGRAIGGDLLNSIIVENKLLKYFGSESIISGRLPMPKYLLQSLVNWYRLTLLKNVKDLGVLDDLIVKADNPVPIQNLKNLIVNDYGYLFFNQVDKTKIALSSSDISKFIFNSSQFSICETLTRDEFENMLSDQITDTKACINECLSSAGLQPHQIDNVLVTGGSSKVPIFQDILTSIFEGDKIIQSDPFTSVAHGLALKARDMYT